MSGGFAMKNYPKVSAVAPADSLNIIVTFENGTVRKYNVEQLFNDFPDYELLRNKDIFDLVHVDCGGYAVAWNDELDITECELWDNSVEC